MLKKILFNKLAFTFLVIYLVIFNFITKVLAGTYHIQDPNQNPGKQGIIPLAPGNAGKISNLESIGAIIINSLLFMCSIVAVVVIAYAGVRYITAGGDTAKAEKAKGQLIWALVGLIVISFSWIALKAVVDIFGRGGYSQINYPTVTY